MIRSWRTHRIMIGWLAKAWRTFVKFWHHTWFWIPFHFEQRRGVREHKWEIFCDSSDPIRNLSVEPICFFMEIRDLGEYMPLKVRQVEMRLTGTESCSNIIFLYIRTNSVRRYLYYYFSNTCRVENTRQKGMY